MMGHCASNQASIFGVFLLVLHHLILSYQSPSIPYLFWMCFQDMPFVFPSLLSLQPSSRLSRRWADSCVLWSAMMSFHLRSRSSWQGSHMKFETFVCVCVLVMQQLEFVQKFIFSVSIQNMSPLHITHLHCTAIACNSQAWHEWPHGWPDASAVGSLCLGTKASMVRHLPLRQFPKKWTETRETSGNTKPEPTYSVLLW